MEERQMNIGQRFWGVLASPAETFKVIGEEPRVLFSALIILGLNLLLTVMVLPETRAFTEDFLIKSGNVSPEMVQTALKGTTISVIIAAIVMPPLIWLVETGLLALYNLFSIGQGKFKQLFAISLYSWLPVLLGTAVRNGLVKVMGAEAMMSIRTSLALFLPAETDSGFLFILLSKADFFVIWTLVLLVLGGSVVMKKDVKGLGFYVFGLWLVYIIAAAFLGSQFKVPGM